MNSACVNTWGGGGTNPHWPFQNYARNIGNRQQGSLYREPPSLCYPCTWILKAYLHTLRESSFAVPEICQEHL